MRKWQTVAGVAVMVAAVLTGGAVARAEPRLSADDARELLADYQNMRAQVEMQQKQVAALRASLLGVQRQVQILREELVRRGVDVELLLDPPQTQPEMSAEGIVFESPEAVAEYLRENFTQRVRSDMTRLQREQAQREFDEWLNGSGLLPRPVSWVVRVADVWRPSGDEEIQLAYASDRQAMTPRLAETKRTLTEMELLELEYFRLRTEQKFRKAVYDLRTREMTQARPEQKALAEQIMRAAYGKLVEVNVKTRAAEQRYQTHKRLARPAETQPDNKYGGLIMLRGRGGRDGTIELTGFCSEHDTRRLLEAPRNSLIKIRAQMSDLAVAQDMATIGIRLDRVEVLAVNVTTPPPPPATAQPVGKPD